MSFRKTISWFLFPLTMWYAVGAWFRNLLYDLNIKHSQSVPVTTISVGNICAGGTGKTPHAEYLLRLLADKYRVVFLSRGYKRKSHGFLIDDGQHLAARLGDEPAMVARKFPQATVAVGENRLAAIHQLLQADVPPQVVLLDDAFQYRHLKPTISILLTEYGNRYTHDHLLPFGNLRESRRARYRANIVVITKTPADLKPIERHNIVNELGLKPYQKVFFSHIQYLDPVPLGGGAPMPLDRTDAALVLTGIANPQPMLDYVGSHCTATPLTYADHHNYSASDIRHLHKAFNRMEGSRKIILTTEKDAARLANRNDLADLPIYYLPITVVIQQNNDINFDNTVLNIVGDNVQFLDKMKNTKFDW